MRVDDEVVAATLNHLPFVPAPRVYKGCMGRIVPGLPEGPVYPGAYNEQPEMVFSWLLHRFSPSSQQTILSFFKTQSDEDFLLSWPDFEAQDPSAFGDLITSIRQARLRPLVMLTSKAGPRDLAGLQQSVVALLPVLHETGVPRVCVGWELNSFLSPEVLQAFIDWLAPFMSWFGALLYVHFTGGYGAWQPNGLLFADFWKANVNKLRGLLHQKITDQSVADYQMGEGGLHDILLHFNGGSFCPADSGDGTPFDLVAFEVNLELCSVNQISESEMHARAFAGTQTPSTFGPTGEVRVMGSGCGL